ncbi:MAG: LysR family transcriptional regulator [Gemmatimonadota bacterium]|nr:LysR family transcriptional regulator [Gemmatimonadota bacterium]
MNLQHLRYFLAVARTGGFTQAARQMNVTQPTVSSAVLELEKSMGVQLFNRDNRHVALTTEGRLLLSYAVQVEDLLEEASERLQRSDLEPGGGFQFGAVDAAVIYLLPEILKEYMRRYPGVALKTQVAPSRYLIDDLLMQRSEFALIHLPYTHPKIDAVPIYRDDMPLVVGPVHRFARCESVALAEVVEEPLILFHADSVSRKVVDEKFAEAGLAPGAVMELRSPEAMRKLVEAGVGISFLPRLTIRESLGSGALKTVEVRGVAFEREIGVAWRRGRYFGQAVRLLLEAVFDSYGGQDEWLQKITLKS